MDCIDNCYKHKGPGSFELRAFYSKSGGVLLSHKTPWRFRVLRSKFWVVNPNCKTQNSKRCKMNIRGSEFSGSHRDVRRTVAMERAAFY